MKTFSTYTNAGWDFERDTENKTGQIWDIDNMNREVNQGFPILAWQNGDTVLFNPYPPTVSDLAISGITQLTQNLTGSYTYSDPRNNAENGSTYQWYRSDDGAGTNKEEITGATSLSYSLVAADSNKYISFRVTPNNGIDSGYTQESGYVGPITINELPKVSNIQVSGDFELGGSVNLTYSYSDGGDDPENGTIIKWFLSSDSVGTNKSEIGSSISNYEFTYNDTSKYLVVEIIPNDGKDYGAKVSSGYRGPIATFSGGDGTENSPYQIINLYQLQAAAWYVTSHFKLMNNINASATSTWNSGQGFLPISATSGQYFSGSFDGQGFVVDSLYINRTGTTGGSSIGFISKTRGAKIVNLGLTNVNISGRSTVGGLIGTVNSGDILFSYVTGSIRSKYTAGGLVGQSYGSIRYCYLNASVFAEYTAGGLVGNVSNTESSIQNSYARGSVQASVSGAGGLAAYNSGYTVIHHNYASAVVSGNNGGGLFGSSSNFSDIMTFTQNFWDTEVSGQSTSGGSRGEGKPSTELKSNSEYIAAGWDFVGETANGTADIWNIDESGVINDGYPYLKWQTDGINSTPVNTFPSVSNLTTTGSAQVAQLITASYNFSDPDGDDESGSEIVWFRGDNTYASVNRTKIEGATGKNYFLRKEDQGKYVTYEIRPKDGTVFGINLTSSASVVGPVSMAAIPDLVITGKEGWRLMSSPTGNQTYGELLASLWTQGFPGADTENGSPNVLTWNEPTKSWLAISNASEIPASGQGFLIYVFRDDNYDGQSDGFPKTIQNTNGQFTGSISKSLDYTNSGTASEDGWNLMGNPYGADIEWNNGDGWNTQGVDQAMYVWSDSANAGNGAYISWNGITGTRANGIIKPWSGFWIKANTGNPQFAMNDSARYAVFAGKKTVISQLKLRIDGNSMTSSALIHFDEQAQIGSDALDSYKLQSLNVEYLEMGTSVASATEIVRDIQSLPKSFEDDLEISLKLDGSNLNGSFTLSWEASALPEEYFYYLNDLQAGTIIDLSDVSEYTFTLSEPIAKRVTKTDKLFALSGLVHMNSDSPDRLKLVISKNPITTTSNLIEEELPGSFGLSQNYPNPFNPSTVISYQLPENSLVDLRVFDMLGREVANLVSGQVEAGYHQVQFNAGNLSSGVYIYRLQVHSSYGAGWQAGGNVLTKKLTLIK